MTTFLILAVTILGALVAPNVLAAMAPQQILLCEAEISPKVRAARNFLIAGKLDGIVTREDILNFAQKDSSQDPLTNAPRNITTLFLKNGFAKNLRTLNKDERRELARILLDTIRETDTQQVKIDNAQNKTEEVLAPKILKSLQAPANWFNYSGLEMEWFQGRPVFVGMYGSGQDERKAFFFDPFNSNSERQTIEIGPLSAMPTLGNNFFIRRNRKLYVVVPNHPLVYDVSAAKYLSPIELGIHETLTYKLKMIPIKIKNETTALILNSDASPTTPTTMIDLKNPSANRKEIFYERLTSMSTGFVLGTPWLAGFEVFSGQNRSDLILVNLHKQSAKVVQNSAESDVSPVFFEVNGKSYLAFRTFVPSGTNILNIKVAIYDFHTEKIRLVGTEHSHWPKDIYFSNLGGIPFLHYITENELVLINLLNDEETKYPHFKGQGDYTIFHWKNDNYVLFAVQDQIQIGNITTGITFGSVRTGPLSQAKIFEYQGKLLVMLVPREGKPKVVQLINRPSR